jgi:head-tail adaptor
MRMILNVEQRTATEIEPAAQPEISWPLVRREWFDVQPAGGSENQQAGNQDANVSHKMRCVFFKGANPRMRLTTDASDNTPARVFDVLSVINVGEENRTLEWQVSEVAQ